MDNDRTWVLRQQQADLADGQDVASLVALAHKTGGGRIYGGRINNWGDKAKVGSAPLPILLGHYLDRSDRIQPPRIGPFR